MKWTNDTLKEARLAAKLSQAALAVSLGVPNPVSVLPALDKFFGEAQDVVPKEEFNKVVSVLNSATELNKKLTDLLQSSIQQSIETK